MCHWHFINTFEFSLITKFLLTILYPLFYPHFPNFRPLEPILYIHMFKVLSPEVSAPTKVRQEYIFRCLFHPAAPWQLMLQNTSLVALWVMCWLLLLHHASNLLSHWDIKEVSEHLKDTLNQSGNASTTDLMFLTSTCHWPNVPCSFHACRMISKLFPKWKSLVEFWWKARLTRKLNNKTSITFTATNKNLWHYLSSRKPGFLWRWYGSPWTTPKSIQIIVELCRQTGCERSPGYLVTLSARWIGEYYRRAIIFFTRTQQNMLLLSLKFNLMFSWRNTVLDCLLSPRKSQVSMYDFIIYLRHKHCHR